MIEEIIEYIKENELDRKSQRRNIVYRRFYLFNLLKSKGMTLYDIGKVLKKDHSTVLHGLTMHNHFMKNKDKLYFLYIQKELETFGNSKSSIYDDIMNANNTTDLAFIKQKILNDEYNLLY